VGGVKDFLRDKFDFELTGKTDEAGKVWIGNQKFEPLDILQTDEKRYEEEYKAWVDNLKKVSQTRYRQIQKLNIENVPRLGKLLRALKSNKAVPFIGAGMSVPMKMRGWTDFLYHLVSSAGADSSLIDSHIELGDFEQAATIAFSLLETIQIDEKMESFFLEKGVFPDSAVQYVPYLFNSSVITTNFDNVIERAFEGAGADLGKILLGRDSDEVITHMQAGERFLFKVHGDYSTPKNRVLTLDEYDIAYSDKDYINSLNEIYKNNTLVFMGCSLKEDRYLKHFAHLCKTSRLRQRHYAFLKIEKQGRSRKATNQWIINREASLAKANILPIWLEDYKTDIDALLLGLLAEKGYFDDV
jgi:SIR2-like domain